MPLAFVVDRAVDAEFPAVMVSSEGDALSDRGAFTVTETFAVAVRPSESVAVIVTV